MCESSIHALTHASPAHTSTIPLIWLTYDTLTVYSLSSPESGNNLGTGPVSAVVLVHSTDAWRSHPGEGSQGWPQKTWWPLQLCTHGGVRQESANGAEHLQRQKIEAAHPKHAALEGTVSLVPIM